MNPAKNSSAQKDLRPGDLVIHEANSYSGNSVTGTGAVAVRRYRARRHFPGDAVVEIYGVSGGRVGSVRLDIKALHELGTGCNDLADEIESVDIGDYYEALRLAYGG